MIEGKRSYGAVVLARVVVPVVVAEVVVAEVVVAEVVVAEVVVSVVVVSVVVVQEPSRDALQSSLARIQGSLGAKYSFW